jgi:PKD repeat protein
MLLRLACLALVCGALGCGDDTVELDGSVPPFDAGGEDVGISPDGGAPLRGAFTMMGCASLQVVGDSLDCSGPAPLRLTFVPLSTGATTFVWTLTGGDPSTSKLITPSVLYARPGSYAVTLAAGGPGGTITSMGTVLVTQGGPGAPCSEDSDCDTTSGLECLCGIGMSGCPGALGSGICTAPCAGTICEAGEECVDAARGLTAPMSLADGGVADGGLPQAWRQPICLPACATNDDCRPGLSCREVPALAPGASSGGSYSWRRACFVDALADDGDACVAPAGEPDPSSCLSGRCDPFGARGLCTSECDDVQCPSADSCAAFVSTPMQHLCLRRCDASHPCADPLLACEAAGQPGRFGFTVSSSDPAGTTYCAPRRCDVDPTVCSPAGRCVAMGGASYCIRD